MGLRGLAGEMARNTSGLWRGVADALDPDGRPRVGSSRSDLAATQAAAPASDVPVAGPAAGTGDSFEEEGGRMIVPLDTWTRILEQVGHVHEAGQQLADARERAARAETENRFLHEQLKELKTKHRSTRRVSPKPTTPSVPAAAASTSAEAQPAETLSTRARERLSNWLRP